MAIKIVLLGYVSASLLDAGMRDERKVVQHPVAGIPAGEATFKVEPSDRAACVHESGRPDKLLDGVPCSSLLNTNACSTAYEHKSRDDHRGPGHSLKGEFHLCEWREVLEGHKCEAGKVLDVCPDEDVVQVTNAGVKAGNQAVTGLLPGDPAGLPAAMQPYAEGENYDYAARTSFVEKSKAQGRCGADVYQCPDGETALRDPALSCRFAPCAGQTSLVDASNAQPTFQWNGVSIDDDQNFCERMTPILGNYQDLSVPDCGGVEVAFCDNHYKHVEDGNVGDIEHCRASADGNTCEHGAIHNCTWSFFMEDLIRKHGGSEDNCASKLLEAKRSLDGLLHSVQDVYNQLMQWNAIVQAENTTIRGLLQDQQNDWDTYVSDQQECDSLYQTDVTALEAIEAEMMELRTIANPDVRSAVDVRRARGYQSSGETSESCPAEYPFVHSSGNPKAYCCMTKDDVNAGNPANNANCVHRNCKDPRDAQVSCVNNARGPTKWGAGTLAASQAASAAPTSFVEMDASACKAFSSLVERVQKKHGVTLAQTPRNCDQKRTELKDEFLDAFTTLGELYNTQITDMEQNRTICLNRATYNYKSGVEGLNGIDDQIQDAAGKIHEAQGEIARLEPMLHDVERAVDRMRTYVETISGECDQEGYLGNLYDGIRKLIVELAECPGRNDFIINVPHWRPQTPTTPSPTPWYESSKVSDGVRGQL